jgi:3-oxoacyl-(acyl-carrier-protein) synthase
MEKLKKNILKQLAMGALSREEAKELLLELDAEHKGYDKSIAIIGMAVRFPDADNYFEYWNNLLQNKVSIKDFPTNRRFGKNALDNREHKGNKKGGFLNSIDGFDAAFFHIAPSEARLMNPLQRLFLEIAYETIEDAGYAGRIHSSNTGVFVGMDHTNMLEYIDKDESSALAATGSWAGLLASRVSYVLNLKGPSMVIDTACSSGLSAVHIACNLINSGECDMALSGGISLDAIQDLKVDNLAMLTSEDNKVRAFDKQANGTVWGEGIAAVLLKPLKKAIHDRDNIHAVIKGSSMNNNGTASGITALDAKAQELLYLEAWKRANINPEAISYIETHGTGTVIGDHIEIKGLTNAFRRYTNKKQFCGIGSVKGNIGHTVGASGMASLVKTVLGLKFGKLPATLNFSEANPHSRFHEGPFYVTDTNRHWPRISEGLNIAGVSAFSFNGTNVHVVLQEITKSEIEDIVCCYDIIFLSARSVNALYQKIKQYRKQLSGEEFMNLANTTYTTNTGRKHHEVRLAIIFRDKNDLFNKLSGLETVLCSEIHNGIFYGEYKKEKGLNQTKQNDTYFYSSLFYQVEQNILEKKELFSKLSELGRRYIEGENIDWDSLYAGTVRRKVSLPTYPFERKSYWISQRSMKLTDEPIEHKEIAHDKCKVIGAACILEEEMGEIIGTILGINEINVNDNFYDIGGNSILTIHLETMVKNLGYDIDSNILQSNNSARRLADYLRKQETCSLKELKESQGIPGRKETIIRGVHGFNPIFYKYCFYNSLFSIVFQTRGNVYPFLSNDIMVYSNNTSRSFDESVVSYNSKYSVRDILKQMNIDVTFSRHYITGEQVNRNKAEKDISLENFEKDLGFSCFESKECNRSVLDNMVRAVKQKHYILLWVDAYYESERADTYHKHHLPHVLLIYGYREGERFIAMEHSAKDILSYRKRYISFEDVYNSYKGFLMNYKDNSTIATYHELYTDQKTYIRNQKEHIQYYRENLFINRASIQNGINDLTGIIYGIMEGMDNKYLYVESARDWLKMMNGIINGKLVEQYQISNLFGTDFKPLALINNSIRLWLRVRSIIAKFTFTEKYETDSMHEAGKMLQEIITFEKTYYSSWKLV